MQGRINLLLLLVGEDGEEIICGLAQVFILGELGEGHRRGEPLNGDTIASCLCGWHKNFITAIVFQGGANIESFDSMRRKG